MSSGSLIAVLVGLLLLVLGKVCLALTSKQLQGWLFDLRLVVFRWARRRLSAALRGARHGEEFVPELKYILVDKYVNEPIVGLFKGFRFALAPLPADGGAAEKYGLAVLSVQRAVCRRDHAEASLFAAQIDAVIQCDVDTYVTTVVAEPQRETAAWRMM
jgi:hypothetical protein